MKKIFRRVLLLAAVLWVAVGAVPPVVYRYAAPEKAVSEASAVPSPTPASENENTYRIFNTADDTILEVTAEAFLPSALLCEMSPDAPQEALKAQAVAILTHYDHLKEQNRTADCHFTCDTAAKTVYTDAETLAAQHGERWDAVYAQISALCAEISDMRLYYEDALITAPFFAISAGCTQPNENVWDGEPLPYLRGTACPYDTLHSKFLAEAVFTPEEIRAAFPDISYTEDPAAWFSSAVLYPTGYVEKLSLCGTEISGTALRSALSLRSAAFSLEYNGSVFRFTTRGYGHGVGMSQAGAVYLAEQGESYESILAFFYPGTQLRKKGAPYPALPERFIEP